MERQNWWLLYRDVSSGAVLLMNSVSEPKQGKSLPKRTDGGERTVVHVFDEPLQRKLDALNNLGSVSYRVGCLEIESQVIFCLQEIIDDIIKVARDLGSKRR